MSNHFQVKAQENPAFLRLHLTFGRGKLEMQL